MPQRKTHDVYAGNQKVGEVWEHYDVFTEEERAAKRAKMIADMILDDLNKDQIYNSEAYQNQKKKLDRTYKVRKVIGIVVVIVSLGLAVLNVINFKSFGDNIAIFFIPPAVVFGLGMGLIKSEPIMNEKKRLPVVDWGGVLLKILLFGVVFLVLYFVLFIGVGTLITEVN